MMTWQEFEKQLATTAQPEDSLLVLGLQMLVRERVDFEKWEEEMA